MNFEDERIENMSVQDLNVLLEIHMEMYGKRPILFLDEIQNIDGWENLQDAWPTQNIAYI